MPSNETSVALSTRSEKYFNELKKLILKSTKNIHVDKFLISHIKSLAGMKILNADTSNKTDKFSNNNVYRTKEVNSNKNEVYMSQYDEVHESQNENSMDISMVHNLPNKECDKRVIRSTDKVTSRTRKF